MAARYEEWASRKMISPPPATPAPPVAADRPARPARRQAPRRGGNPALLGELSLAESIPGILNPGQDSYDDTSESPSSESA